MTAVRILDKEAGDAPQFVPLVKDTAKEFTIDEVSADKAYASLENFEAVAECGGTGFIASKASTKADAALMPIKAVAVNEAWKPDLDAVVKAVKEAAIEFDPAKSTSAGKLVKAYKKGSVQYGVIEIKFTLLVTKFTAEGNALPLVQGSTMKQTFRFEGCIDGSEQTGKLDTLLETHLVVNTKSPDGKEVKIVRVSREPMSRQMKSLSEKK